LSASTGTRLLREGDIFMRFFTNLYVIFAIILTTCVAEANFCKDVVSGKTSAKISDNIKADKAYSVDVAKAEAVLKKSNNKSSPVPLFRLLTDFRNEYLPLMRVNSAMTEAVIRFMEAELRINSNKLAKKLSAQRKIEKYDLVIVGGGVHGVVALQSALKSNQDYKVLLIEASDTAAPNFRYANDIFNINSSNRASGKDRLPLPGEGNINELPRLPIQVSDISAVKYPTAGDLGAALVAGLYSADSVYYNVDVLLNSNVQSLKSIKKGVGVKVNTPLGPIKVKSSKLSIATGLGKAKVPRGIKSSLRKNKELLISPNIEKTLPRVITFEDFIRLVAKSENPKKFISNKVVSVVGTGDSANVAIEFMLGFATDNAYGLSSAQTLGPKKINWLGQGAGCCEEFIVDIRSRYAQIGTGFRSSSSNVDALIESIPNKVSSVQVSGLKKVEAILEGDFFGVETVKSDFIILATGYNSGIQKLISGLLPKAANKDISLPKELFLERYTDFVMGRTTTSDGEMTRTARSVNIGGRSSANEPKVIINGPAAGELPLESELAGVIQNTVSIFNNAPRTESSILTLLRGLVPGYKDIRLRVSSLFRSKDTRKELKPKKDKSLTAFEIGNLTEVRRVPGLNDLYLQSVLAKVLSDITVSKKIENSKLELNFYKGKKSVIVASNLGNINIRDLIIDPLVATRDFFNSINEVLTYESKAVTVHVPIKKGEFLFEDLTLEYSDVKKPATLTKTKKIDNPAIKIRGI